MTNPDFPENPKSVLVVDDDDSFRATLVRAFERRGWEAWGAAGVAEGLELAERENPDHIVVDLKMADGNGIDLVRQLVALDPLTSVVLLTGFGSIATAVESMRAGAVHYLTKPADVEDIIAAFGDGEG